MGQNNKPSITDLRFLLSFWFAQILFAAHAQCGGISSAGGADDYRILPAFFTAWRAPMPPVKACYEVSENFGISKPALEQSIRDTFRTWGSYLHDKKLDVTLPSSTRIRADLKLQPCDGTEELKFYFGIENSEVTSYKSQFTHPFGFAALTSNSPPHGIVWIAPPNSITKDYESVPSFPQWSAKTQDAFAGLLLHEVGHVFGNGHVDDTVMTSEIGHLLENDTVINRTHSLVDRYSRIDSIKDLFICTECNESYPAAERFDVIDHEDSDWANTFKFLVGRPPVLPMTIRFDRVIREAPYRYPGSGVLQISDAKDRFALDLDTQMLISDSVDSPHLFEDQGGTYFQSSNYIYLASLRSAIGGSIPVSISYNADHVKVQIKPGSGGTGLYVRPLFVSGK